MTTALIPLEPATPGDAGTRILNISANLLPPEIVAARRARLARHRVLAAVAVVALLCVAWYAQSYYAKRQAETDLATATTSVSDLQAEQRTFGDTIRVQSQTAALDQQLAAVMASDLDWGALLATLRTAGAASKIQLDGINGTLASAEAAGTAVTTVLPGASDEAAIGSIQLTGTAPDQRAVAAYAEALGRQSVLTNPYVSAVAGAEDGVSFSLSVDIPPAALCGRFTVACPTPAGN
jgi:hypothetical protein